MALISSRRTYAGGRPPGYGGGTSGSRIAHWASVRSIGEARRDITPPPKNRYTASTLRAYPLLRHPLTDWRFRVAAISRSAGSAVRSQPQIDRLLDLQGNVIGEWQVDRLAGGGGEVGGVDDLEHGATVFGGHQGLLVALDAVDEVLHLLREAVVPALLVHGEGPADRRLRFLDRVAVADVAVGGERRAPQQVGSGIPLRPVDLRPVVNPTTLHPGVLAETDGAALEGEHADRVVLAARLVTVDIRPHRGVDLGDGAVTHHPTAEGDRVAPHIEQDTASGAPHVPEPGRVGSRMFLALLDD